MAKSCRESCPIFQLKAAHYQAVQGQVEANIQRYMALLDQIDRAEEQSEGSDVQMELQKLREQFQEAGLQVSETANLNDEVMAQMDADLQEMVDNCSGLRLEEANKLEIHCGGISLSALQILTASMSEMQSGTQPQ